MVPIGVTVQLTNRTLFRIPITWRGRMNIKHGKTAKIYIQNNSIIIKVCDQYTVEINSTIGRNGKIYIPAEVRNYFHSKGIQRFNVFIDEVNKNIILRPSDYK